MSKEKTLVIDLRVSKKSVAMYVAGLIMVTILVSFPTRQNGAVASAEERVVTQSTGMRQYYLTEYSSYEPDEVFTACAEGYHFASLWELVDPSNLKYNTTLGAQRPDSGQGPPSDERGWIRTGYISVSDDVAGKGNCALWTDDSFGGSGTVAWLPNDWTGGYEDMGVWTVTNLSCQNTESVWCIED